MPRINPDKIKDDNSKQTENTQNTSTTKIKKTIKTKTQKKPLIQGKEKKQVKRGRSKSNIKYFTADGHPLTPLEAKFIDLYIETGNQRQSVIDAGYQTNSPGQYAQSILKKDYIANEIANRLKKLEDEKIASAEEILKYFTSVMRGEVTDQFGLEAPLSERTKAAQELAKRKIDVVNKVNGKEVAQVQITLNWEGMDDGESEAEQDTEQ